MIGEGVCEVRLGAVETADGSVDDCGMKAAQADNMPANIPTVKIKITVFFMMKSPK